MKNAHELARDGWTEQTDAIYEIVDRALELVEREQPFETLKHYASVSGGGIDIAAYLSGVPECMTEYEPQPISRAGRTVALVASGSYSAAVSTENMVKRGSAVTALALALERTQHAVEIWLDHSYGTFGNTDQVYRSRVLVKGPRDVIDPERIAFALAHPSSFRRLGFAAALRAPKAVRDAIGIGAGGGYGLPTNPALDLPDGTIYLDAVLSSADVPDPDRFVTARLKKLGLISGDED
jgi:hypothetical protein